MAGIADLLDAMPPHTGAGESIDWREATRIWGKKFPQDYQSLVGRYGEGCVEDFLEILVPISSRPHPSENRMKNETQNAKETWRPNSFGELPAGMNGDELIAWGLDSSADILCWAATDENPDRWPVVVYERHGAPSWKVYDCGMVEFLVRIIRGDFEECPLSGTDIWEYPNPRFLHWKEEERIRARRRLALGRVVS